MLKIEDGNYEYRQFVDMESFAKWLVAEEVIACLNCNRYYVLQSKNSKLEMYPIWDAEWSLGLAAWGNPDHPWGWYLPPSESPIDVITWSNSLYFKYMTKDPEFRLMLHKEWEAFKVNIPKVCNNIKAVRENLKYAQKANFDCWPILNQYISVGLVALGSWDLEVDYINEFFEKRLEWCDHFFE